MVTSPKFGIDIVGDIPWGTHLCQFYETKQDLIDILVPYFAEGLRSNEACMWVTSAPLEEADALEALTKAVPDIDRFLATGQLLILPYTEWHMKGGTFDADRVMEGWLDKEQEALNHGFEGLRLAGNTFWIERSLWDTFTDYEEAVNDVITEHRIIAVCPYHLGKCAGSDVTDVIRNHVGALIKKEGTWLVVEDVVHRREAEAALQREQEEVKSLNEELRVANETLQAQVQERAAALAQSEGEFRTLFDNSPLAQITYDVKGYPTRANKATLVFLGIADVADIRHLTIFTSPRVSEENRARLRVGLSIRYEQHYDFKAIRASGDFPTTRSDTRDADVHIAPLFDTACAIDGYLTQIADITDRKRAEEERESVAKFPEENPHPVFRLTPEGSLLYANQAGETLLENTLFPLDDVRESTAQAYASGKERVIEVTDGTHSFQLTCVPIVDKGYVNVYGMDISERKRAEKSLKRIEWLLTRRFAPASHEIPPYGDLTALNTSRVLLDAVGAETLASIATDYLDLLDSSSAVYERNGDYALGIFTSGWCRFFDAASRELCDTDDNRAALASGAWHCHESCWSEASKQAINTEQPVDISCRGGIRLYAVPIRANGAVVGAINFGYGDPPREEEELHDLAERYKVPIEGLRHLAAAHESRPPYIVDIAKRRLETAATLIGSLVERRQALNALQESHEEVQMLNEELQSTNEELRVMNENLEQLVQERTEKIASINEELQSANEELRHEVGHRTRAERAVRAHTRRTTALNQIIHVLNEAQDLPTLYNRALTATVEGLHFDRGAIVTERAGHLCVQNAHNLSPDFVQAINRIHIDEYLPARAIYREGKPIITQEAPPESVSARLGALGAAVGIPFYSEGKIVGHIALYAERPRSFTDEDRQFFIAVGEELGTAVAKLRAKASAEEYARQQGILTQIIAAGNEAPDLRSLAQVLVDRVLNFTQFDAGVLFLLNKAEGVAELRYARGLSPTYETTRTRIPVDEPHMTPLYRDRRPFLSEHTALLPSAITDGEGMALAVAFPILAHEETIGHFGIFRTEARDITEGERALLKIIGQEAGSLVARMQAEEKVQEHAQRADILSRVILAGNKADSLKSALVAMVDATVDLLGLDAGGIFLRDTPDAVTLQYARGYNAEQLEWAQHIPLTQRRVARVMAGTPWISDDYQADISSEVKEMNENIASMATIPLMAGDVVVGFYQLASCQDQHRFADEERELLISIGQEAGTVIARLQAEEVSLQRATMLDHAHDAIVVWGINDHITYWNQGAERLYGWQRDEAIGKNIHALLNTTFPEPLERIQATLIETGRWEGELTHTTRAGTKATVESHMTLQRAPDGEPVATLEINNDITEQKQVEEQLRASARYERSLIEVSLDPLVTISAEGTITDVNKATEEVTGCSRDELIGSDFSDYFTEPEKARAGYKQVFTDGFVRDYPLAIRHTSGEVTDVLYNATVYRNKAGEVQGVFAAARDITDRKRAEEELQRYSGHLEAIVEERTAQLKDAERLAGIGETAAMIGHDLRNPLQGLQYIVDLQKLRFDRFPPDQRGPEDWKKEQELFDRISEQVFYMDKIVGDLQDYARPLRPESERITVKTLIDDVLQQVPHTDGVRVMTDIPELHIEADRHLMHRVFTNIILNAIQAMPDGGMISVSGSGDKSFVAIRITDDGVGIPDEMREKLFKPLITDKAKGTGLGLAVVKRIVEAHGGTIEVESEVEKGTTFTITLPIQT